MSIDYDTPKYPIREAAMAAGYTLNTLRSLYQRGHFRIIGGEEAKAKGLGHALNLRDILCIAVANRLMLAGVHPKQAFDAAIGFAHSAEGGPNTPQRDPAGLFDPREHGFTVLIYFPITGADRIIATQGNIEFSDAFIDPHTRQRTPSILVLLNDVEREVFSMLRVHGGRV